MHVLDKCMDLSADTGHHSGTDYTALECGLMVFLRCPEHNKTPDLLYLKPLHAPALERREMKTVDGCGARAHLYLSHSERPAQTEREGQKERDNLSGRQRLGVIAVFSLHAQLL